MCLLSNKSSCNASLAIFINLLNKKLLAYILPLVYTQVMQTFLQYPDFHKVAETLDPKRLGKQRVEATN